MGNGEVLRPGEFQRMAAGTGITHSEFNPSSTEPTHLYQIWLFPERKGLTPSYEQKSFPAAGRHNELRLVASRDGAKGSLKIHTDASIYLSQLDTNGSVSFAIAPGRSIWLQVLSGSISVNGVALSKSDGVAISGEESLAIIANQESEIMLFDLA
jgi:hypothetical protein